MSAHAELFWFIGLFGYVLLIVATVVVFGKGAKIGEQRRPRPPRGGPRNAANERGEL